MDSRRRRTGKEIRAPGLDQLAVVSAELNSSTATDRRPVDTDDIDSEYSSSDNDTESMENQHLLLRKLYGTSSRRMSFTKDEAIADRLASRFRTPEANGGSHNHSMISPREPDYEAHAAKRRRLRHHHSSNRVEETHLSSYLQRTMQQLAQLNTDLSLLVPAVQAKRYDAPIDGETMAHVELIKEEVMRIKTTLETVLGKELLVPALASSQSSTNNSSGCDRALQSLRMIQAALKSLQSFLQDSVSHQQFSFHSRPMLEKIWTSSRQCAEEELRGKLCFWKYKALDLQENLKAVLEDRESNNAVAAARTTAVLNSALKFVSTMYLFDVANEPSMSSDKKDKVILETAYALHSKFYELEAQRLKEIVLPDFSSLATETIVRPVNQMPMSIPTQMPNWATASNVLDPNFSDASDPSEEDEPLPVIPVTTGKNGASTRAAMTTPEMMTPDGRNDGAVSTVITTTRRGGGGKTILPAAATGGSKGTTDNFVHATASVPSGKTTSTGLRNLPIAPRPSSSKSDTRDKKEDKHKRRTLSATTAITPMNSTSTTITPKRKTPDSILTAEKRKLPGATVSSTTPTINTKSPSAAATSSNSGNTIAEKPRKQHSSGCAICHKNDSYHSLLLCDNECGREFHTFCLDPPLDKIPEGDWYCPPCRELEAVGVDGDIFRCSAAGCEKITAARYCSMHRCRQPNCLNRIKAGGFCRRHEVYRVRPKRSRTVVYAHQFGDIPTDKNGGNTTAAGTAVNGENNSNSSGGSSTHDARKNAASGVKSNGVSKAMDPRHTSFVTSYAKSH